MIEPPEEQRVGPNGIAVMKICEEVSDEVDYQPGKLFRRQFIRPVYASPAKTCAPRIAELTPRVVSGGQVGPGLVAHVLLSKYADAIPLYRQEVMLDRLGPGFSRQAMGEWVEQTANLFRPVHACLRSLVVSSGYVLGDETPVRVLDPVRSSAAREAWLWTFLAWPVDRSQTWLTVSVPASKQWRGRIHRHGAEGDPKAFVLLSETFSGYEFRAQENCGGWRAIRRGLSPLDPKAGRNPQRAASAFSLFPERIAVHHRKTS